MNVRNKTFFWNYVIAQCTVYTYNAAHNTLCKINFAFIIYMQYIMLFYLAVIKDISTTNFQKNKLFPTTKFWKEKLSFTTEKIQKSNFRDTISAVIENKLRVFYIV